MGEIKCMLSDVSVDYVTALDSPALVVVQNGKVIGLIRTEAQEGIKTIRMTFTRSSPAEIFTPMQGQGIEFFHDEREE